MLDNLLLECLALPALENDQVLCATAVKRCLGSGQVLVDFSSGRLARGTHQFEYICRLAQSFLLAFHCAITNDGVGLYSE